MRNSIQRIMSDTLEKIMGYYEAVHPLALAMTR